MGDDDLSRIWEIRDCVLKRGYSGKYFENFDASLEDDPIKQKHFLHVEAELTCLDAVAWKHLKARVVPLFKKARVVPLFKTKSPDRGWQAVFDKLNEAKAYNYLARLGCSEPEFIPESTQSGQRTPDLQAKLSEKTVLCEVKTINPSDVEFNARGKLSARSIQGTLPDAFFCKLQNTLCAAKKQMSTYCPDADRQIVYVVLNFDDNLHEYIDNYLQQIQHFCIGGRGCGVEIVFDVKPKFYSASSDSGTSQLFGCSKDGTWRCISAELI